MRSLGPIPSDFDGAAFAATHGLDASSFIVEGGELFVEDEASVRFGVDLPIVAPATGDRTLDGVVISRRTSAALVVAVAALSNGVAVPAWARQALAGPAADIQLARASQQGVK